MIFKQKQMEKTPEIKRSFKDIYGNQEYPKKDVEVSEPDKKQQLRDLAEVDSEMVKEHLNPEDYEKVIEAKVANLEKEGDDTEFANQELEEFKELAK